MCEKDLEKKIIEIIKQRLAISVDVQGVGTEENLVIKLHVTDSDGEFVEIASDSIKLSWLKQP